VRFEQPRPNPATLDADGLYSTNLHSKSPFSHFQDERLDRLVEEGRSTLHVQTNT
jgi:hypothetical protein